MVRVAGCVCVCVVRRTVGDVIGAVCGVGGGAYFPFMVVIA